MEFVPYHQLDGRPHVVLDGSPTAGTALVVTHWPGYPPPAEIADDLSAQMAFRLLARPDLVPARADVVTNNHFDQDGLVSLFALVDPDAAVPRRRRLEDVAAAGDFAVYRDRDAARMSMALAAAAAGADPALPGLPDDYPQRTGILYEELLGRLAGICDDVGLHRELWAEEDDVLAASEAALAAGNVRISERADVDLAVVDVDVAVDAAVPTGGGHRFGGDWAPGLHPMAVHNATPRLVVATIRGRTFDVEQRYESWVQLRSRPLRLRRDLTPLARRLQDEERGDAVWTATAVGNIVPRLASGVGDSSIPPDRFVDLLADHLRTAPPAWDPFAPIASDTAPAPT